MNPGPVSMKHELDSVRARTEKPHGRSYYRLASCGASPARSPARSSSSWVASMFRNRRSTSLAVLCTVEGLYCSLSPSVGHSDDDALIDQTFLVQEKSLSVQCASQVSQELFSRPFIVHVQVSQELDSRIVRCACQRSLSGCAFYASSLRPRLAAPAQSCRNIVVLFGSSFLLFPCGHVNFPAVSRLYLIEACNSPLWL